MRKQQQVWQNEHAKLGSLPGMADTEPASAVIHFVEFLKKQGVVSGTAADIGSGKGRNGVYLALNGFEVYGLEYIDKAIKIADKLSKFKGVPDLTHFINAEIDEHWLFKDNFFDIAVDSYSSIDVETERGRITCIDEMYRTLKPGGYALVTVCSTDDEWERELILKHPGPEHNSSIWPLNGKFQKNYDEEELKEFYKDFQIVKLEKISKPALKMGRNGLATNFRMIIRK